MLPYSSPAACLFVVFATLQSGCATTTALPLATEATTHRKAPAANWKEVAIPVVRYGRYTLVELVPESAQRNLLQQVIDVAIPSLPQVTVGDALRHVLLRSGYRLCDAADAASLYALPLPAAHALLGPLMVRDALLTLAGPTWQLSVDERSRQICFSSYGESAASNISTGAIVSAAAIPEPLPIESPPASSASPVGIGATTAIPERSFRVLGTELRGGKRVLSVRPKPGESLAATQLLGEGDTIGDWRLLSIDGRTALFDVNGLRVRVALP